MKLNKNIKGTIYVILLLLVIPTMFEIITVGFGIPMDSGKDFDFWLFFGMESLIVGTAVLITFLYKRIVNIFDL